MHLNQQRAATRDAVYAKTARAQAVLGMAAQRRVPAPPEPVASGPASTPLQEKLP